MTAERTRALLDWYRESGRDLPWRSTSEPWPILVSEVMSQQTQISRVIPAWGRFMERYPTPGDLATSDRSELIRLWAGLGYQRRALNLQRTAAIIDETGWPTTVDGLCRLPGIGPYTAAAVACFAFGAPVPAIDTNLKRILSRWHGEVLDGGDLSRAAASELPNELASEWNQALMDLGATRCRPRQPRCGACPVSDWCVDPSVYQPPPRQTRFEGSIRQARAATMRALAHDGALTSAALAALSGLDQARIDGAITSLLSDGSVERRGEKIAIAES